MSKCMPNRFWMREMHEELWAVETAESQCQDVGALFGVALPPRKIRSQIVLDSTLHNFFA